MRIVVALLLAMLATPLAQAACTDREPCNVLVSIEANGVFVFDETGNNETTAKQGDWLRFQATNSDTVKHELRFEELQLTLKVPAGPDGTATSRVVQVGATPEISARNVNTGHLGAIYVTLDPVDTTGSTSSSSASSSGDPGPSKSPPDERNIPIGLAPLLLAFIVAARRR